MSESMQTEKQNLQAKLEGQLATWREELEGLRSKTAEAGEEAKAEMKGHIQALEAKLEEGKGKLAEIAETSEEAFGTLKDGFESAWSSLSSSFGEAVEKLKK